MFKWIARAIFILPPVAIFVGWFYLNYLWFTGPHPEEATVHHMLTAVLDFVGVVVVIVVVAMNADVIAEGVAWLWRRAEWTPRNSRRY